MYLANLTRALLNNEIDSNLYFKLGKCIINLTEEDLKYIESHITTELITNDEDYIDDYRSASLLKEVDGGFEYTRRAFELKKYALNYESKVEIPKSFSRRIIPRTKAKEKKPTKIIEPLTAKEINAIWENN
jgi:hypothetical protein